MKSPRTKTHAFLGFQIFMACIDPPIDGSELLMVALVLIEWTSLRIASSISSPNSNFKWYRFDDATHELSTRKGAVHVDISKAVLSIPKERASPF